MATATVFQSSCFGPSSHRSGISISDGRNHVRFGTKSLVSTAWSKYPLISHFKLGQRRMAFVTGKRAVIRASSSDVPEPAAPIAPLQLESPVGQFLSQILKSHPHLVPAAVEQQLEQFQTDRDAEKDKEEPSASGTDLVLYRRIAEVKANDKRKALEEILYALVVQKFMDANVSLVPAITTPSSLDPSGRVDTWPSEDEKLERLHSPEAYEMIQNHLALILGNRLGDLSSVAQISKLRVGQVYAASVMYGYFLKRVDQRFQLEKTMKILPQGVNHHEEINVQNALGEEIRPFGTATDSGTETGTADSVKSVQSHSEVSPWAGGVSSPGGFGYGIKPSRLRTYVMSFDGETIQRYATIRSKEAITIIEKHTEALFGRPEITITPEGTVDSSKDEIIKISFGGLRRLVLEAVTFGSFLWDVESYVDSRYHFVAN
ncbi:UV-B-induced protein At3g17800, chloroplastic-like isoform X2 [Actinidia eriantha]|uniref:UV-B-induced protein At3g17800, chloroplastic-like isoform X2 n=1 Tax=Actinidia eriantha TaxID=165200 RepID=UPI00258BA712|nr:UV-B-induced protein At3g17800, chloroplastic-like isoform X2 [Actinidia eriantha]